MGTISNAEWEVMRVVWTKQPTTSRDIIQVLGQAYNWSASTIKTLITRLSEKGFLTSQSQGKKYIYTSLISEDQALKEQVSATFSRICVTKHRDLIKQLIEETPMTQSDIEVLQAALVAKKKEALAEVTCQCRPGQCSCHEYVEVTN